MKFLCEDLPRHGLALVPPSSPDYDTLLADIERRAATPVDGAPPLPEHFRPKIVPEDRDTSAILLNQSAKAIAALQVVWRFETESGRSFRHSKGMLSTQSLLLPFGRRDEAALKLFRYWDTILPGSKRYLGRSGMVGDNTDVRPPAEDEKWRGGIIAGGGGGGGSSREPIRQVTLALDGVFFLDGEFVGPNRGKLYEETVADAEAHMAVAKMALEAHSKGLAPREILAEIEKVTGPAPERPSMVNIAFRNPAAGQEEFRQAALERIAYQLAAPLRFPQGADNERMVVMVLGWNDTVLPNFRRSN